ncbi:MAG: hypothetical protein KIT84_32550 [Labilithrix sp.]|nr:hypothetical protein [Labilithrix sp.]MCW5815805.1 hypothetical protein [Labilithrix sp.]
MSTPYRSELATERPERAELLYRSGDLNRDVTPTRAALQLGLVGGVVAVVIAGLGYPPAAAGVVVVSAAAAIWRRARSPEVGGVLFTVDSGELVVTQKAARKVIVQARLHDVLDVRLDTKEVERVVPGDNAVPGVRFINTNIAPKVDVARIVIVLDNDRAPVLLTEQFLAHMDSVEWVGKIRSFLRKQGWVPADERAGQEDDDG